MVTVKPTISSSKSCPLVMMSGTGERKTFKSCSNSARRFRSILISASPLEGNWKELYSAVLM